MIKRTTRAVVSIISIIKKKLQKSCDTKLKTFFKRTKTQAALKIEDFLTCDQSLEFSLMPLRSRVFRNVIKPTVIKVILAIYNIKIMVNVESCALTIADPRSFSNIFKTSSIPLKMLYVLGVCVKFLIICNGCNTIRETVVLLSTSLAKDDLKKTPVGLIILKADLQIFFNVMSLELKIFDLLYYLLALMETRRLLQSLVKAKFLRQVDFMIFLVIILIQILFTILDSINLNSSKK